MRVKHKLFFTDDEIVAGGVAKPSPPPSPLPLVPALHSTRHLWRLAPQGGAADKAASNKENLAESQAGHHCVGLIQRQNTTLSVSRIVHCFHSHHWTSFVLSIVLCWKK